MGKIEELKSKLKEEYDFCCFLNECQIEEVMRGALAQLEEVKVASLRVGCVKLEAVLFKGGKGWAMAYDVYVKDAVDSKNWIPYESPNDKVLPREQEMFTVLDRVVEENSLSYTECCFETMKGKPVAIEKENKETHQEEEVDMQMQPSV